MSCLFFHLSPERSLLEEVNCPITPIEQHDQTQNDCGLSRGQSDQKEDESLSGYAKSWGIGRESDQSDTSPICCDLRRNKDPNQIPLSGNPVNPNAK